MSARILLHIITQVLLAPVVIVAVHLVTGPGAPLWLELLAMVGLWGMTAQVVWKNLDDRWSA